MDWQGFDGQELFDLIRDRGPADEAERTIQAFECLLEAARGDPLALEHLLVAAVSLVAFEQDETPRTILDRMFRRSVSDEEWRREYARLFT